MTTDDKSIKLSETVTTLPDDEDLRILTYKTLLEKFNNKYTKLSGAQKNLLRDYINNVSNTNSLKDTLKQIVKGLKRDLTTHSNSKVEFCCASLIRDVNLSLYSLISIII